MERKGPVVDQIQNFSHVPLIQHKSAKKKFGVGNGSRVELWAFLGRTEARRVISGTPILITFW
eukprot:1140086-Pelagomonas_calceolata.AAC.8